MPDISTNSSIEECLAAFKNATFGEDVRDALIASINLCYQDVVKAVWQMKKGDSITNATIQDGHLILTITNNETQESRTIDAGVVKGDKGDQGPKGDPGDTGPEHEWNVDGSFSQTSVNPIQNRVITAKLNEIITDKLSKSAVDNSLSLSSTNPVQNKIITARLNDVITAKVNKLSIDTDYVLISNGTGGMKNSTKKIGDASALHSENDSDYIALESAVKQYSYSRSDSNQRFVAWAQVDDELDEESENPVQNQVIATKIAQIEHDYSAPDPTIDITSTKPIQNRAVAQALNEKVDSDDFNNTIFDDIDLVFSSTNGGIYYNGNSPSQVPALFIEGAGTDPDFTYYLSYIDSLDVETHRIANITSLVNKVIKIDTELNENSTNPVQNKVIADALNSKMTVTEITGQPSSSQIAKYTDPKTLYMFYCGISGINDYVSMIFISSNEEAETPGGETLYPNSTQFAIAASTGKIYTRTADEDGYFGDFHDYYALKEDVGDLDKYVKSEAERLSDVVRDRQGAGTITFISISDFHNNIGDDKIEAGNKHALQAVKLLCERLKIDFVCGLGDYTWCAPRTNTTHDKGKSEIMAMVNGLINSASGKPMFLTTGNHDPLIDARHTEDSNGQYVYINPETDSTRLPIQAAEMFPLVEIYNCYNSKNSAGYGYKDFENYKLRVICLNTVDVTIPTTGAGYYNTNAVGMSTEQAQWFANSLDLTDKEDCAEWKTIVVSHFPLDWGGLIPLVKIIKAFEDGTSGSISFGGGTVTYDYNEKNAAQIVAQFHGHVHGFKVDNLHYFDDNSVLKTVETQRIAIPNACFYRTNEYGTNGAAENNGIEFGVPADGTTYAKTANTANDTAFNVITLDFANRKIYADNYGAGYDREITIPEWSFVPVVIPDYMKTDYIPTATDDSGSILNGVGYIDGKRLSTSGKSSDYRDVARCTTSGYIPIEGGNTLHFGGSDCVWTSTGASNVWSYSYIYLYDENKAPIAYIVTDQGATTPAIPLDEFNYYSAEISPSTYTWKNSNKQTVNDLSGVRYCRVTVEGHGVNLRAYIE